LSPAAAKAKLRATDLSALVPRPRSAEQRWRARLQLIGSCSIAYGVLAVLSNTGLTQGNAYAVLWLPEGLLAAVALRSGLFAVPIALLGTVLTAWCQGGARGARC